MIGEILKNLRKEKGKSQQEISNDLGVSRYIIGNWEQERSEPSSQDLIMLADYFDVSIDYLVGKTEDTMHASVSAGVPELKPEERTLLFNYSRLDRAQKLAVDMMIDTILKGNAVDKSANKKNSV